MYMHVCMYQVCMYAFMYGWMNGWMDGWMDGWIDTHTTLHVCVHHQFTTFCTGLCKYMEWSVGARAALMAIPRIRGAKRKLGDAGQLARRVEGQCH